MARKVNTRKEVAVEKIAHKIGDVVVKRTSRELVQRFEQVALLENAIRETLIVCQKQKISIWKDVIEKYDLSDDFTYAIDHITGDICITGINRKVE